MELAIPLIALGGMYVISNQNNKDSNSPAKVKITQENFSTMGKKPSYLPNTNIPPQNFPVPVVNVQTLIVLLTSISIKMHLRILFAGAEPPVPTRSKFIL